jgi:anti-sigma factor ChrR (cupin superfamily)
VSNVLPIDLSPHADARLIGQAMHHLASALAPMPLDRELRERMRRRVIARAATQPEGTRTLRAHEGWWATFAPGVSIKLLRADTETARMTALIRMQPGSALPGHRHEQAEECLVLEGELFIGRHRLEAGDLHVAPLGTDHQPISSPAGALLLVHAQLSADLIG